MLRAQFESEGIIVEPTNYGRFDALKFLWGSRRTPVDAVWESVRDVRRLYPGANISFLAHSFGTYIVASLLQREFDFKAHRVIFCGSVVHHRFPFNQIAERFTPPLVNETSARDPWPVLGESSTWGYGSAGTYGFKVPRVRDRWHRGFGHSQYLSEEFCKKFWVPFFKSGKIIEGDLVDEKPPFWIQFVSVVRIKYIVLLLLVILLAVYLLKSPQGYPEFSGPKPSPEIPTSPGQISVGAPLGPKPHPDCYEMQQIDSTVFPARFERVWKCP